MYPHHKHIFLFKQQMSKRKPKKKDRQKRKKLIRNKLLDVSNHTLIPLVQSCSILHKRNASFYRSLIIIRLLEWNDKTLDIFSQRKLVFHIDKSNKDKKHKLQ